MGVLEDLASHLAENSTKLVLGQTLYLHTLPELDDQAMPAMCLQLENLGAEVVRTYGAHLPVSVSPTLIALTRSTAPNGPSDYTDPRRAQAVAWRAWELLEATVNETVPASSTSGTFVFAINAESDPVYIGRDERRRALFEQRLELGYMPSTSAY